MTEKFEVLKKDAKTGIDRVFTYTGTLFSEGNDWVRIETTIGEVLRFRKEQIQHRTELNDTMRGHDGQNSKNR